MSTQCRLGRTQLCIRIKDRCNEIYGCKMVTLLLSVYLPGSMWFSIMATMPYVGLQIFKYHLHEVAYVIPVPDIICAT